MLWLLFRAESLSQWLGMIIKRRRLESTAVSPCFLQCFEIQEYTALLSFLPLDFVNGFMALLFYAGAFLLCLVPENACRKKRELRPLGMLLAAGCLFLAFLHLGGESVFVYFNF